MGTGLAFRRYARFGDAIPVRAPAAGQLGGTLIVAAQLAGAGTSPRLTTERVAVKSPEPSQQQQHRCGTSASMKTESKSPALGHMTSNASRMREREICESSDVRAEAANSFTNLWNLAPETVVPVAGRVKAGRLSIARRIMQRANIFPDSASLFRFQI